MPKSQLTRRFHRAFAALAAAARANAAEARKTLSASTDDRVQL